MEKIEIPEGCSLFVWVTCDCAWPVVAKDQEEAYRKVIANRISTGQTIEDAEGWFEKNDQLILVDFAPVTDEPYAGELADDGPEGHTEG